MLIWCIFSPLIFCKVHYICLWTITLLSELEVFAEVSINAIKFLFLINWRKSMSSMISVAISMIASGSVHGCQYPIGLMRGRSMIHVKGWTSHGLMNRKICKIPNNLILYIINPLLTWELYKKFEQIFLISSIFQDILTDKLVTYGPPRSLQTGDNMPLPFVHSTLAHN